MYCIYHLRYNLFRWYYISNLKISQSLTTACEPHTHKHSHYACTTAFSATHHVLRKQQSTQADSCTRTPLIEVALVISTKEWPRLLCWRAGMHVVTTQTHNGFASIKYSSVINMTPEVPQTCTYTLTSTHYTSQHTQTSEVGIPSSARSQDQFKCWILTVETGTLQ